jgi:phosphatidylserine/phosphatidylglycerophosphate/cardiolipin synthase-like enzyme
MSKNQYLKLFNVINKTAIILLVLLLPACSEEEDRIAASQHDYCAMVNHKNQGDLSDYLAPFQDKMQHSTGVYVLEQGTEAMFSRAWLSEQAQQTIDVQYFIFSPDNIGLIAMDYLVRAAQRGVKVRLLVDDIMIDATGNELLKLAAHPNFSIKIYNPMANMGKNFVDKLVNLATDFHGFNQRMHNKTFTVDSKIAITGGRNVADEYFGYDHTYNFRDRDVLLLGQTTRDIQSSFDQFWHHPLSVAVNELVETKNTPNINYDALHQYACNPLNYLPEIREKITNLPAIFKNIAQSGDLHWIKDVQYLSDEPGKNKGNDFLGGGGLSTDKLISLIKTAKSTVTIQTPYLVTTELSRTLFKQLVDRGVTVKILTNSLSSNDNLEAFSGYQRDRAALLNTGVDIFEFKPNAKVRQKVMADVMQGKLKNMPIFGLHAKSMVIDDDITVIGTFNLDPRSANLNTESITIIPSPALSKQVKAAMLVEMQADNAWQTTLDWNPDGEESLTKRLGVKLRRIVPKNIL